MANRRYQQVPVELHYNDYRKFPKRPPIIANDNDSFTDLAAMHRLLDTADVKTFTDKCPTCMLPFDKGKKRRLRDNCGHERCYTCMIGNEEGCPVCKEDGNGSPNGNDVIEEDRSRGELLPIHLKSSIASAKLRGSEITLYGEYIPSVSQELQDSQLRPKVKTNGHFTTFMQSRSSDLSPTASVSSQHHPDRLPKSARPPTHSGERVAAAGPSGGKIRLEPNVNEVIMTQSCPTPPQSRRKFFLSPRVMRSPFSQRGGGSSGGSSAGGGRVTSNDSAFSAGMSASMTTSSEGRHWPSRALCKIRSLWTAGITRTSAGLGQLVSDDEPDKAPSSSTTSSSSPINNNNNNKPPGSNSCSEDMYMRLGLLLGNTAVKASPRHRPATNNRTHPPYNHSNSSLASYDTATTNSGPISSSSLGITCGPTMNGNNGVISNNTSPVSTLTGSSEDHLHHHLHVGVGQNGQKGRMGGDSVGSLLSMSGMGDSGANSAGVSPIVSRRHSVTTTPPSNGSVHHNHKPTASSTNFSTYILDDLDDKSNGLIQRRACIRRSARSGTVKGQVDPRIRFAQYRRPQQLTLKPLFFEVPLQEPDPLFLGREWLLREVEECCLGSEASSSPGILLTGNPGTGKTALILQLVEHSCFGRRKEPTYSSGTGSSIHSPDRSVSSKSDYYQNGLQDGNKVVDYRRKLANRVVAYHFCQADNNNTCLVPDFIHSLAAQLCQAPQLAAYRDYLLSEHHLQSTLSLKECIVNPDVALNRGILEPLASLQRIGKIDNSNYIILLDALCEAEYHRPDHGDTITSFLAKHVANFPSWLKIICTIRAQLFDVTKQLPFTRISLDNPSNNDHLHKDIVNYISFRLNNSPSIQSNITLPDGCLSQHKFSQHLVQLSSGSFLFAKLTLDLLERGNLVAKSTSYKVLPVTLAQIYLLHFNLRFPTVRSFEKVSNILSVCLAALYPLTLVEIYYSINSLLIDQFIPWKEFLQRFKLLSGFLVKRLDNTFMFFHPSFREWLIRRDDGESSKFLCDLRAGHAAIAFRMSRVQGLLDAEKTLELGHHVLKAHVYRNMTLGEINSRDLQSTWILQSTLDPSAALCNLRNIYSPNVKVSRLLLLSGASPDHITEYLGSAPVLCMFASEGSLPMVALLLEFGARVEETNSQGSTALALAAARGWCDVVRELVVVGGASPGHADTAGHSPLVHAARSGHLPVVAYLLACDWHSPSTSLTLTPTSTHTRLLSDFVPLSEAAQQALVAAAAQDHCHVLEYVLDMASDDVSIDARCSLTGETALTVATRNGCGEVAGVLLNRGASVSTTNKKEMPPLLLAVKEGHLAVVDRLVTNHAALEQSDNSGRTALMHAASEGHINIIELLLDRGALLEKQDRDGLTALGWACLRGRQAATQLLLDRGAHLQHTDKTGRTPLDLAAFQGNALIVQGLLERGAQIEHVDVNGMRPLDRAIGCRNVQVVQCFLKKGAKLGPATWAMAQGKPDILLILLNKLLEDGNLLYRKSRLREAAHRYQYALKKFPNLDLQGTSNQPDSNTNKTFHQLKINFLLNYSRCKRKLNELEEAIDLANHVLDLKADSYEAYYALAKAKLDLQMYEAALHDVHESIKLIVHSSRHQSNGHQSNDVERILHCLKDDILSKMNSKSFRNIGNYHRDIAISVDTLHE